MKGFVPGKQYYFENKETANYDYRGEYLQRCKHCGADNWCATQTDNDPEYYTWIATLCECGEKIEWKLPVN